MFDQLRRGSHGVSMVSTPPPHSPLLRSLSSIAGASPCLPFIGNPFLLGNTLETISPISHRLRSVYGPIITLPINGCPSIFISDHAYAPPPGSSPAPSTGQGPSAFSSASSPPSQRPPAESRAQMEKQNGCSYVDSLLRLEIPEKAGGRKLIMEGEMGLLCSEFLSSGSDATSTTLEWVMANLVKHSYIKRKLAKEIELVREKKVGNQSLECYVGEEDLQKMKYLRAVVMETLRRHSPTYFIVPHAELEEVEMDGYMTPKNASVCFPVVEMGRDGEVWEEPMEFRPEGFLEEEVDITGTK